MSINEDKEDKAIVLPCISCWVMFLLYIGNDFSYQIYDRK